MNGLQYVFEDSEGLCCSDGQWKLVPPPGLRTESLDASLLSNMSDPFLRRMNAGYAGQPY